VIQYNQRDLADPYRLEELHRKLDMRGAAAFESVASQGTAVLQALTTVSKAVIRFLRDAGDALAPEDPAPVSHTRLEPDAAPLEEAEPAPDEPLSPLDEEEPAGKAQRSLSLASAGPAEILDERRLRLPVVLVEAGTERRVGFVLTLELQPAGDEDGLG
jgi:hypothetical protein